VLAFVPLLLSSSVPLTQIGITHVLPAILLREFDALVLAMSSLQKESIKIVI